MVASVAMKGVTFSRTTMSPFSAPVAAPRTTR